MINNLTAAIALFVSINANAKMTAGIYEVPVSETELQDSRLFLVERLQVKRLGEKVSIRMQVPVELTGEKNFVRFEGKIGEGCQEPKPNLVSCTMIYQTLKFDNLKAAEKLAERFQGQALMDRMRIQQKFSTDPVGVIHLNLD